MASRTVGNGPFLPYCVRRWRSPAASRCPPGGPCAASAGSAGSAGCAGTWPTRCPGYAPPPPAPRPSAQRCLDGGRQTNDSKSCDKRRRTEVCQALMNFTQNAQRFAGELQPPPPSFVATATSGRPDPQSELRPEDEDGEGFLIGGISRKRRGSLSGFYFSFGSSVRFCSISGLV